MSAEELAGCVIVSGMPAAGKSTVTRLAARLVPRAAQIKADDVNEMVRQEELCNRNVCAPAANSSTSASPCSWTSW